MARAVEQGVSLPAGHERLTDRLVDAGALHPLPAEGPYTAADVTLVCPAHVRLPHASAWSTGCTSVLVDDASPSPLAAPTSVALVRRATNGGPAASRNTGLDHVTTPLVAFVDTDVEVPAGSDWMAPLIGHFADPRVALVAPRVRSTVAAGALAAYERHRSPLDMGPLAARVAPGTRVSYVPAAMVLCRTDALHAVGGFDASMRVGEDVDLVWRLVEAGWRCRYEPAVEVCHEPRRDLRAWLAQRVGYGTSAAPLAVRHPGALAPLRISGWSMAVWLLLASGRRAAALAVAGGTTAALRRTLHDLPAGESVRLAGLGHLRAGLQVADAVRRVWWPFALAAALVSRRARRWAAVALLAPLATEWRAAARGPDPVRYTLLRVADDAAYGVGVWRGVWRLRTAAPLVPDLRNWPRRDDR